MNTGFWMGNLTRDVELKEVGGTNLAKFGIAINNRVKKKDGTFDNQVTFLDCEAWGGQAEVIAKHFNKGKKIVIQASLKQDTWEDKNDGTKRSKISLKVEKFWFCDEAKSHQNDETKPHQNNNGAKRNRSEVDAQHQTEDDVPF